VSKTFRENYKGDEHMAKQYYLVFGDDGHGAGTPGKTTPFIKSLGRAVKENEFNSAVVARMKKLFEDTGVIFIETAPGDADRGLTSRTNYVNQVYKDYCAKYGKENVHAIFISIHYNALDGKFDGAGKDPEGHSIHIYPGSKTGRELANHIHKFLVMGTKQKDRGIVEQNLAVTRQTIIPAILSENGFMDNEVEALYMVDPDFQQEVAEEHFLGAMSYFGLATTVPAPNTDVASEVVTKPAPKPAPSKPAVSGSVVDYMKSKGMDASFANRKKLAGQYGIKGYEGTASQNLELLEKLMEGTPKPAPAPKPTATKVYKDVNTSSVVDFLKANGEDASFGHRAQLARTYGIGDYEGTAGQNTQLLNALRKATKTVSAPKPAPSKPKGDMKTTSVVDYLKSIGQSGSFAHRSKLAKQYGISGYKGTASQNTQLLNALRK
jgi:N-acetylmuramoyl-L-alanine amidase